MEKWIMDFVIFVSFAACIIGYTAYFAPILYRKCVNFRVSLQKSRAKGYWTCWKLVIGFKSDRASLALALEDLKLWSDYSDMATKHKSHWEDWDEKTLVDQYRLLERANRKGMPYGGHRAGFITRLADMEKSLGGCPWHGSHGSNAHPWAPRNRRREAVMATKRKGAS